MFLLLPALIALYAQFHPELMNGLLIHLWEQLRDLLLQTKDHLEPKQVQVQVIAQPGFFSWFVDWLKDVNTAQYVL